MRCLHEIFEDRAHTAPARIAVSAGSERLTYGELDARADRLALRLRNLGVGPDVLVGLCATRGIELIVGLLGILKAGGAYVPIDPSYPAKRVGFLLEDSGVPAVVATRDAAGHLAGCSAKVVWIDDEPAGAGSPSPAAGVDAPPPVAGAESRSPAAGADSPPPAAGAGSPAVVADHNLAYVIYTSGSTGTPKGVLVEHRNAVRLFEQTRPWFEFDDGDVWTLFHSASFDFSVWEIWGALLHGGRLVIVPAEVTRSPEEFHTLLLEEGVTVLNQTPSAFRQLVTADARRQEPSRFQLRHVIFGGERLDVEALEPWISRYGDEHPRLVNMYGITETTVHVTYRRILAEDLKQPESSPIGVPIPDLRLQLLDDAGAETVEGEPGHLYVSGAGLARGYLNRPELTEERFPLREDGTRLYDSGDRAVRLPGGEFAYLGRSDDQIKVRGFRVEPREIELCLLEHPRAGSVVVTHRDYGQGDVRLLAFVVPSAEPYGSLVGELAERAGAELPAHARPSAYHIVSEIPLTPQGKADRGALNDLAVTELGEVAEPEKTGGSDPVEDVVLRIAEDVLARGAIPAEKDLFDLGATSLAFTRIVAQVNEHFGLSLTGGELEDLASVECLAACVRDRLTG
ncbi:amino acid adenylation domain-containing protein [Streptosporangium subroseum]|uniref:amino acid adenylation domain-containing protein n=1 Tax=Streptosporangium subroseum TaxID=106412 RepID=UPI00308E8510|nr:amino acid adenylation domain-containing protein [Streptosporangium subroseum]